MFNSEWKEVYWEKWCLLEVLFYLDIFMGISMKLGCKDRGYFGNCKKEREEIGYFFFF